MFFLHILSHSCCNFFLLFDYFFYHRYVSLVLSGASLQRTEWHTHDRGRWKAPVGEGPGSCVAVRCTVPPAGHTDTCPPTNTCGQVWISEPAWARQPARLKPLDQRALAPQRRTTGLTLEPWNWIIVGSIIIFYWHFNLVFILSTLILSIFLFFTDSSSCITPDTSSLF